VVRIDFPVRQQVQILVEHLPVQLRERQAPPAALAENAKYHCGFLHFACLMVSFSSVACASSPCGPALPVARLAGRHPGDYYRRSDPRPGSRPAGHPTFTTAVRIERDLGVPFASFNALTRHRSCAPEDYRRSFTTPRQGPAPVSGVFPAGARFHLLEAGLHAVQLSPYRAGPPAHRP
jgi:hypothetical protein